MFAVTSAFMLVMFIFASPFATAKTNVSAVPKVEQAMTPDNPMYKYINHVPVTEHEWPYQGRWLGGDMANTKVNLSPTAPETDHLLWKYESGKMYDAFDQFAIAVNGLVLFRTDSSKSIYNEGTYALDQNSGKLIWSIPSRISFEKVGGVLWSGDTAFDPDTGQSLYTLDERPTYYDPDLQMAWTNGPTGYSWTNTAMEPVEVYDIDEGASIRVYDSESKILFCERPRLNMTAYDARTGTKLWEVPLPGESFIRVAADGKVFCSARWGSAGSGVYAFSQETGELLWQTPMGTTVARGYYDGLLFTSTTRTYWQAYDANDGHVVWRYGPIRDIPHWAGGTIDCNHTNQHSMFYELAIADGKIYATSMQRTTYGSLLPPEYPGIEYPEGSGVYYWQNPNPFPAIAHTGENEFVCLDAYTGKVNWRVTYGWPYGPNTGTADSPAYAGPDMGFPLIADGKVYGVEMPFSSHTAIGDNRPEIDPLNRYPESIPKFYITHTWYPGRVYCFGPGPVQLSVSTASPMVTTGQNVEITVTGVDMSPAMKLTAAKNLPISLSYVSSTGSSGHIANVETCDAGEASVSWTVPVSGTITIIASSPGSGSYEAPADASATVTASGGATFSTFGTIAGIIAITVSAAAITVPIRKRKHEGDEHLEA
jgi:outer membrane protein assembly factor BamB